MKRNFLLFSLLIIMIIFTYFFEEKGHIQATRNADEASKVLNFSEFGALKSFNTSFISINKRGEEYRVLEPAYGADTEKIEAVFSVLSSLKIRRVFTPEERKTLKETTLFPEDAPIFRFVLERGEVQASVGKKLVIGREFYIKLKKTGLPSDILALAYDDSPVEGVYSEEEDKTHNEKYQRLLSILSLKADFYLDTHLIKPAATYKKILIDNLRNRPFEVFITEKITKPEMIKGISFSMEATSNFLSKLHEYKAKKIDFTSDPSLLKEPLGKIMLITEDNRNIELRLYKKYKNQTGYFVFTNQEPFTFEVTQEASFFFFSNVQTFWERHLLPWSSQEFTLVSGDKKIDVALNDKNEFISKGSERLNPVALAQLWNFLSYPADRIDELTDETKFPSSALSLQFANHQITFISTGAQLHVIEPKLKLRFVYYLGEMPIRLNLMDYLR